MFSIGIPAFKSRYLKECIDSILNQTYEKFELIIVNDCSPEPIENIVNHYNDARIRYYKNDINFGAEHVVDNWNKCLNYAQGEYFILMGDDDKMESNYLEEFIKLINKYPDLDVYHCRSKIIDENSKLIEITPLCPKYESTYEFIIECLRRNREQFISDFVFKRSTLQINNGFYKLPLAWCSDYTSVFIACGQKGIAYTSKTIFCYRRNRYNITNTGSTELKRIAMIGMETWLNSYLKQEIKKGSSSFHVLKKSIEREIKVNKISFCRQIIGASWLGLVKCILKRHYFKVSIGNIFNAVFTSLFRRLFSSLNSFTQKNH